MPVAKDRVTKYFHQIPDSDSQWKCVCGKVLSQKKTSGLPICSITLNRNTLNMLKQTNQK